MQLPSIPIPYNISTCHNVTLKKLINRRDFHSFEGILTVFIFLKPRNNNNMKAGNPIITLKLKGGITSIATLNKDQTELQTKTNNIKRITGTIFCEKRKFISKPTL